MLGAPRKRLRTMAPASSRPQHKMLIVTDSLGRGVGQIKNTEVRVYPGLTVGGLTAILNSKGNPLLSGCSLVLFHVGTNDIDNGLTVRELLAAYMALYATASKFTEVAFSSILHRPKDFQVTCGRVKETNIQLASMCASWETFFLSSFKPFLAHNRPVLGQFDPRDLLHLSQAGKESLTRLFQHAMSVKNQVALRAATKKMFL